MHFVSDWCWSGNVMDGKRGKVVSSAYRWWFKERYETILLSGVVYMTKSRSRTENWALGDTTEWQRHVGRINHYCIWHENSESKDRIWTSLSAVPWMPNHWNQEAVRVSKILWAMVSKAADRSRGQRQEIFREPMALIRWCMYRRAVSVEWCLQ